MGDNVVIFFAEFVIFTIRYILINKYASFKVVPVISRSQYTSVA